MDIGVQLTLVRRLRNGDASALEELMERYAASLYRIVYAVTRNSEDAEEVVQDVFLSAFRKLHTFEGRAKLSTWLYRIAINTALNKRRGKRADVEVPLEDCLPTYQADGHRDGARAFVLADWSQNPEAELLSLEARAALDRAIDGLPPRYRIILVLRDVEGLSNEETSALLAEPVSAVKSCLHRARMALREQLTRIHADIATVRTAPRPC